MAAELAAFMRRKHVHGVCFDSSVILIDVQHIQDCEGPDDALLETILTAVHEYAYLKHPRWSERRIKQWWKKKVHPRRQLLEAFAKGLT